MIRQQHERQRQGEQVRSQQLPLTAQHIRHEPNRDKKPRQRPPRGQLIDAPHPHLQPAIQLRKAEQHHPKDRRPFDGNRQLPRRRLG